MIVFRFLERRRLRKLIKTSNQKLLEEGLIAMSYLHTGIVTELRLNGRVLMLFGFGKKSRAAIISVTNLICLFKNLNVIDLTKLKEIAFESALNKFKKKIKKKEGIKKMSKKIREQGIVLSKVIKPATERFIINEKVIEAKPERPTILVACGEFDGDNGIQDLVLVPYVVTREEYDRYKFMDEVTAAYEYSGDNKAKPVELTLS